VGSEHPVSGRQKTAGDGGPWIGRPLPRFEDFRLLRGAGRFTDDVTLPGEVFAAFVRSPHAHALIKGVDAAAARAKAYAALQQIEFAGMHYRRDIGLRA
jgi:CO/xanthine dehydrogenase Mo-binding subunit